MLLLPGRCIDCFGALNWSVPVASQYEHAIARNDLIIIDILPIKGILGMVYYHCCHSRVVAIFRGCDDAQLLPCISRSL